MARRAHSIVVLLAIGIAGFGIRSVPAQNAVSHAGIVGRIVDLQSRSPIRDAHIALLGTPLRAATDSSGRFAVDSLRSGTYVLQARATGYEVTSWVIPLHDGELLEQAFELPPIGTRWHPSRSKDVPRFFSSGCENSMNGARRDAGCSSPKKRSTNAGRPHSWTSCGAFPVSASPAGSVTASWK